MNIQISAGTIAGPTKLSAFDSALNASGVANYNLIRLSSIIPPASKIQAQPGPISLLPGEWGDRLYVVMADMRVDTPNQEAWAGIGWMHEIEELQIPAGFAGDLLLCKPQCGNAVWIDG